MEEKKDYYILCLRHQRKENYALVWWKPDGKGYTYGINRAGKYKRDYFPEDHKGDIFIPCEIVEQITKWVVYEDEQLLNIVENSMGNRKKLEIKKKDIWLDDGYDKFSFMTIECAKKKFERLLKLNNQIDKIMQEEVNEGNKI